MKRRPQEINTVGRRMLYPARRAVRQILRMLTELVTLP